MVIRDSCVKRKDFGAYRKYKECDHGCSSWQFTDRCAGTIAIAIGSPLGTNYSILTGNITSTTNSISTIDHNYSVFTTDIVGSSNGSGALVNVDGEIIGIVMQGYSSAGDENTLTAISISELKALIEMLRICPCSSAI